MARRASGPAEIVRSGRVVRQPYGVGVPLEELPAIDRLLLAEVTAVPSWHPEHATFEPFPVYAWVIRHPESTVLVDTGIGVGSPAIDEWYRPRVTPLAEALAAVGLDAADIDAVVLSHLHFDHCGQVRVLEVPVYVQAKEHEAAQAPRYTVADWSTIPDDRLRLVDGDVDLLEGVSLMLTPGHTPGHQSMVVEGGGKCVVLGAQCAFRADELRDGEPRSTNLHDEAWRGVAKESLARVLALAPTTVHLSHDAEPVELA